MVAALIALGCFSAAWHYALLAAANTVDGVPMAQALMARPQISRDRYTAMGQRHLARRNRFILGAVLSASIAVSLFARAGYQLPERRVTDHAGSASDRPSNDR